MKNYILFSIYFISGLVSLVYQTIWLRELGLVFGNSVHSSSVTISLFFTGLALGSWIFSKNIFCNYPKIKQYFLLELLIGLLALAFIPLKSLYWDMYPLLSHNYPEWRLLFQVLMAAIIIIPPTLFMGATFPVLGSIISSEKENADQKILLLYFSNIFGACLGTFLTGFILPQLMGFNITYILACLLNIILAFYVYFKRDSLSPIEKKIDYDTEISNFSNVKTKDIKYSFLIGFIFLGLEICWIKSFSLVFHNSIYTYASILLVVIFSIGLGALTPAVKSKPRLIKFLINNSVQLAFFFCLVFPFLFIYLFQTKTLFSFIVGSWHAYSLMIIFIIGLLILPAAFFSSLPFPLMLKKNLDKGLAQKHIGTLYSANTFGGILGSLLTGLFLIPSLGTWGAYFLLCFLFLPLHIFLNFSDNTDQPVVNEKFKIYFGYFLGGIALLFIFIKLPPLAVKGEEQLLWYKENAMAQVSVVKKSDSIMLKINNSYYLGGTGTFHAEKLQSHIPFAIQSTVHDVYLLGLGTGITAGEVLKFDNKKMLVAELNPDVILASQLYFKPYINNLYNSPNAKVIADDGRTVLYGSKLNFDTIIADLFVTWNKGVGSLYSLEHFQKASQKLNEEGLYVQWLPFYNFFREEFWTVVKTMKKVFPRVTMWQLMLHPEHIVVGLIGHKDQKKITKEQLLKNLNTYRPTQKSTNKIGHFYRILSYFYADLSQCEKITNKFPTNTEDFPFIEFHSPKSAIVTTKGKQSFLLGKNFIALDHEIRNNCRNRNDFLSLIPTIDSDIAIGGRNKILYNIKKSLSMDNNTERNLLKSKIGLEKHQLILKSELELQ